MVEGPSPFSSTEVLGDAFSNTVQLRLFRQSPAPGSVVCLRVERSLVKVSARNEVLNPCAPEFIPRPKSIRKLKKEIKRRPQRWKAGMPPKYNNYYFWTAEEGNKNNSSTSLPLAIHKEEVRSHTMETKA